MHGIWKTDQPMVGTMPLEQFEELIMSNTSDLGMGRRKDIGKTYCYAFIILYINGERYCRYSIISEEELASGESEHQFCAYTDAITAQNFYSKYIMNHEIFYDGIYNENILNHYMTEIKEINTANHLAKWGKYNYEDLYGVISGKVYKQCKIMAIVVNIIFFIVLMMKLFVPDPDDEMIWLNLMWVVCYCFETSGMIMLLWMILQKKKFLKLPDLEIYREDIPGKIVKSTPTEVITKHYIFKRLTPASVISLEDVVWIYRKRISVGNQHSDNIIMCMQNGKKQTIPHRVSFDESDLFNLVKQLNPQVMIGQSMDNYTKYKSMIKSIQKNNNLKVS